MDAKSVWDAAQKGDTAASMYSMKEKYAALELMAVTESMQLTNTHLLWVSSEAQLVDGLTKSQAQDQLRAFFNVINSGMSGMIQTSWRPRRRGSLKTPSSRQRKKPSLVALSSSFRQLHAPPKRIFGACRYVRHDVFWLFSGACNRLYKLVRRQLDSCLLQGTLWLKAPLSSEARLGWGFFLGILFGFFWVFFWF